MTSPTTPSRLLLSGLVIAILGACGPEADGGSDSTIVSQPDVSAPTTGSGPEPPENATLHVNGRCITVSLRSGQLWTDSCVEPQRRVRPVKLDEVNGVMLALMRVPDGTVMVRTEPAGIRWAQLDGWILAESSHSDFAIVVAQEGFGTLVCDYNPLFIECAPE